MPIFLTRKTSFLEKATFEMMTSRGAWTPNNGRKYTTTSAPSEFIVWQEVHTNKTTQLSTNCAQMFP